MTIQRFPARLLVMIAESAIERPLVQLARECGARGYTAGDVRGGGAGPDREGEWEADRTVRIEIICQAEVADRIAEQAMARWGSNYRLVLYFGDVEVLRPQKY